MIPTLVQAVVACSEIRMTINKSSLKRKTNENAVCSIREQTAFFVSCAFNSIRSAGTK